MLVASACGKSTAPSPEPVVDAGRDSAKKDAASFVDLDSGPSVDAADPTACASEPGWQVFHPFSTACTMAVAPPEKWPDTMPVMQPCRNGQAKCTELNLPRTGWRANYAFEPESGTFFLGMDRAQTCRKMLNLRVDSGGLKLAGAAELDIAASCHAVPDRGNGHWSLSQTVQIADGGLSSHAGFGEWGIAAMPTPLRLNAEFANVLGLTRFRGHSC
jgi:hypothetical protein